MPLAMSGRTKDAVVVVPAEADWRSGVRQFLRWLGGDPDRITRHLDLLDERAAGRRPWAATLDGRTLPNGRPMPPGRAYAEMLVEEGLLPLYDAGGFTVSVDLHNPGNEAGVDGYDPSLLELAIVADVGAFAAGVPGSSFDPAGTIEAITGQRAERGAALGRLVAALAEAVGGSLRVCRRRVDGLAGAGGVEADVSRAPEHGVAGTVGLPVVHHRVGSRSGRRWMG